MRRLAVLVAALAFVSPAAAAPPPVHASAYVVEDARTGEVLASSHAHAHLPIASITKLMTVLLTLEHHKLSDVVTADRRAAVVGESTIELHAGEQFTVRDLIKAALIQSANDAAAALALSISPDYGAFAALMNAKAQELDLRDTHFVRPDGLDVPGQYSSAADVTKLGQTLMRTRFIRDTVREETDTISGGPDAAHVGRPAVDVAANDWRQDGAYLAGRLVSGRGRPRPRRDRVRDAARRADARGPQRRPRVALDLGPRAVPRRAGDPGRTHLRDD